MQLLTSVLLLIAGLVTGFIDSIAGGGGLISLPSLGFVLGLGPHAIGTNKIVGTMAAAVALWVYARRGHFQIKQSLVFTVCISIGAFLGSRLSPFIPPHFFKIFLLLSCPLLLWVVWKKDLWIGTLHPKSKTGWVSLVLVITSGVAVGFYDGLWGPGGGTFMLLSLLFIVKLPLLQALAASKFANTVSAGTSLISYASQGFVHWPEGITMAIAVTVGAYFGARLTSRPDSKHATRFVRVALGVVATLLAIKLIFLS